MIKTTSNLTSATKRALDVLVSIPDPLMGCTANTFAAQYYRGTKHEYLLSAVSNQGEGACAGKKAWLCAGSYLSRLAKTGLVMKRFTRSGKSLYAITEKGQRLLRLFMLMDINGRKENLYPSKKARQRDFQNTISLTAKITIERAAELLNIRSTYIESLAMIFPLKAGKDGYDYIHTKDIINLIYNQ